MNLSPGTYPKTPDFPIHTKIRMSSTKFPLKATVWKRRKNNGLLLGLDRLPPENWTPRWAVLRPLSLGIEVLEGEKKLRLALRTSVFAYPGTPTRELKTLTPRQPRRHLDPCRTLGKRSA
jgi:hypothetical protein